MRTGFCAPGRTPSAAAASAPARSIGTADAAQRACDQSPISEGSSRRAQALANTIDLARLADRLGYHRYWVAEHHGGPMLAGPAPGGADRPDRGRDGADPGRQRRRDAAPLQPAQGRGELQPARRRCSRARIDLGIGRAAGTDPMTTYALQRDRRQAAPDDFPRAARGAARPTSRTRFPRDHPFARAGRRCPARPRRRSRGCSAPPPRARSGPRSSASPTRSPTSSTATGAQIADGLPRGVRPRRRAAPRPRRPSPPGRCAAETRGGGVAADRVAPHGDGDAAPRPARSPSRRSSRRCASSRPRASRSRGSRRITAGTPEQVRAGARDDRAAVRRRRGDRRHDHPRPRRAAAVLRAAGRARSGSPAACRAPPDAARSARRRARGSRRRRRSSRAPRRRRRGPRGASISRISLDAPSSSSSTRVLGSWATSALSTSMPASSSAARTAVRSAGSHVISKTSSSSPDVLGARVDRDHQVVLGVALAVDDDDALLVEQVRDGARLAEVAAVLGERVADLGAGAVAVVRRRLDEHRHAAGAVALVGDGLERLGVGALAGALRDRALDVVLGHRGVLGLLHGQRERGIALDVAAALLRRHRDGARELGEELAAAGVDDRLLVLDPRPFGMTGHGRRFYGPAAGLAGRPRAR